ncbi:MAG: type II toxin-antitoxin system Phd/YefM family antitoxin [Deltaproteobacteria bacterium]|nr:type II toxin-antitoxin system Phd/YefM family antitoxin [Deltaproteobacteria bacterium]
MKIPDIVPVSDLRQNTANVFNKLQATTEPLVITQRGRAIAVIQNIEEYERCEHERELLHLLALGEKEIGQGAGETLSSLMQEADALLSNDL